MGIAVYQCSQQSQWMFIDWPEQDRVGKKKSIIQQHREGGGGGIEKNEPQEAFENSRQIQCI